MEVISSNLRRPWLFAQPGPWPMDDDYWMSEARESGEK